MNKLPFYLGNLAACFVFGSENRSRVRGTVNIYFYKFQIKRFLSKQLHTKLRTLRFVRQRTLNRVVCVVNDEWFVKIFRNVSNARLKDFEFISNYIRPYISVHIPKVIVSDKYSMYACRRVVGRNIDSFSKDEILQNKDKIQEQVFKIIDELQAIDVNTIPNHERFLTSLQTRMREKDGINKPVLAHFDLNVSNLLFDDDLNIISVIDWDSLSIAKSPETDKIYFTRYYKVFLQHL